MILIVEDDAICRRALEVIFVARGQSCFGVGSAEEALTYLETHPTPGIILSDIDLPGMNGWELLTTVRTRYPELPYLLMSANDSESTGPSAQRIGLVPKPLNLLKLMQMLTAARAV